MTVPGLFTKKFGYNIIFSESYSNQYRIVCSLFLFPGKNFKSCARFLIGTGYGLKSQVIYLKLVTCDLLFPYFVMKILIHVLIPVENQHK